MCTVCGCPTENEKKPESETSAGVKPLVYDITAPGQEKGRLIQIERDILSKNDKIARSNSEAFAEAGSVAINLMSSPGSGKTTLLVETLKALRGRFPTLVIEGDQHTSNDADRIRETGAPAIQINTGKVCHLDAQMIADALDEMPVETGSVVFIENVGNLLCPASFDLGESARVVLVSVTEGEDKPLKYPEMFATADLVLVTKSDLLPHLDFDVEALSENIGKICPGVEIIRTSTKSVDGLSDWLSWISAFGIRQSQAAE
ncbi:MAG: hydrogenase nickel incorporation protein HypB [Pseudomonadota bacterium]